VGLLAPSWRRAGTALTAAALVLGLGACGSDEPASGSDEPLPTLSDSPSASASTGERTDGGVPEAVPTTAPDEPARADKKTDAGAKAFAKYALSTYWYAASRQDIEPILALTPDGSCPTCAETKENFAATPESYEVPDHTPRADKVSIYLKEGSIWHVSIRYDLPDGTRYFTDGRDPEPISGEDDDVMEMDLQWGNGSWKLAQYRFPDRS
jgi:hypothetical protein